MEKKEETFEIELFSNKENKIINEKASIWLSHKKEKYIIKCKLGNYEEIESTSDNYFSCFTNIRLFFEKEGYWFLCNAARKDAFPSTMNLSMGGGVTTIFRTGTKITKNDVVSIFEPAPPSMVTSTKKQLEFKNKWLSSFQIDKEEDFILDADRLKYLKERWRKRKGLPPEE